MVFENVIEYNEKTARVLVEVDSRVLHRKGFLVRRFVLLAVGSAALVFGGLMLLAFGQIDAAGRAVCVGDLAIGGLVLWKGLFYRRVMVRRMMRAVIQGPRRITFTEGEIQGEHAGVQKSVYYYSTVAAIYETEDCFVLPMSIGPKGRWPSIILDKGGFTQGTVAEFRDFIQSRTGITVKFVDWQ